MSATGFMSFIIYNNQFHHPVVFLLPILSTIISSGTRKIVYLLNRKFVYQEFICYIPSSKFTLNIDKLLKFKTESKFPNDRLIAVMSTSGNSMRKERKITIKQRRIEAGESASTQYSDLASKLNAVLKSLTHAQT
ncbi:MAG: hypothetical protein HQL32_09500 [Planctomycetes bacterium]|nr:hypothetical protein [Planctomycetota bacterium]